MRNTFPDQRHHIYIYTTINTHSKNYDPLRTAHNMLNVLREPLNVYNVS